MNDQKQEKLIKNNPGKKYSGLDVKFGPRVVTGGGERILIFRIRLGSISKRKFRLESG